MTELSEYAANIDITIARESIRAVGKIALQQYDVNAIVDRLLQFFEMEKDHVTAETLVHWEYLFWDFLANRALKSYFAFNYILVNKS